MTQEHEDLLLQDLCARLPYGVKVSKVIDNYISNPLPIRSINLDNIIVVDGYFENGAPDIDVWSYEEIKPSLFRLSSMTERQKIELTCIIDSDYAQIDWYNKNHFDYRGLIEKGVAINATGLNIY